jgi:hypothetical protein
MMYVEQILIRAGVSDEEVEKITGGDASRKYLDQKESVGSVMIHGDLW